MQSIRKWIEFSKLSILFLPKKSIFAKKKFEIFNKFDRNFWIFSKNYLKFSNFMKPINPEKFSGNSPIWLRNLQWRRKEFFRVERSGHLKTIKRPPQVGRGLRPPPDYWKWHENSWNFWRKSTGIYRKCKIIEIWWKLSIEQVKVSNLPSKTLLVCTKNEENFERFQENFEIFWSKSLWKIDFFHYFY